MKSIGIVSSRAILVGASQSENSIVKLTLQPNPLSLHWIGRALRDMCGWYATRKGFAPGADRLTEASTVVPFSSIIPV
jgi:hypothetical protein